MSINLNNVRICHTLVTPIIREYFEDDRYGWSAHGPEAMSRRLYLAARRQQGPTGRWLLVSRWLYCEIAPRVHTHHIQTRVNNIFTERSTGRVTWRYVTIVIGSAQWNNSISVDSGAIHLAHILGVLISD